MLRDLWEHWRLKSIKNTVNNCRSYLHHLNKSVNEYNNTYHQPGKKPIHADYFALIEEIEPSYKSPKFEIGVTLKKVTLKIGRKNYLWLCVEK